MVSRSGKILCAVLAKIYPLALPGFFAAGFAVLVGDVFAAAATGARALLAASDFGFAFFGAAFLAGFVSFGRC